MRQSIMGLFQVGDLRVKLETYRYPGVMDAASGSIYAIGALVIRLPQLIFDKQ